ncbi:hypothetical protein HK105_208837 [Polyrhizophydium stewartii]|uniref:CCHC-type domain-containing protein n=1 Tax=Polyrhizophydium stewartii TaxID=2732419 RepID=A0ABR4MWQ8_9FUNG
MADPGHHIEASTQTAEMVQALCVRLAVTEYRLEAQAGVNVFVLPLTGAAHLLERFAATADALADRPPNPERLEDKLFNYALIGSTERALQAFFFNPAGGKGSSSCKDFAVSMASHLSRVDPRVTNSRRCELIADRLRGTAALWALDERMSPDFDQLAPSMLLQKLLATFNSGDSPHELEEQLRTFRQGSAPLHDALQLWRDLMARTGLRTDTPEGFFLFRTMITNDLRIKMLSVVQSQSFEKYADTALAHDTHLRAEKKAIAAMPTPRAAAAPTTIASSVVPMGVDAVTRSASGSSTSKRFTGRCFYCKFVGHRVAECRGKATDEKTGRTDHKDKGYAAVEAVSPLPSSSSSSEN